MILIKKIPIKKKTQIKMTECKKIYKTLKKVTRLLNKILAIIP